MGPPEELIAKLKAAINAHCFIETGTYMGATARWASENFEKVITIENAPAIFQSTSKRYSAIGNIEFIFGHTTEKLKEIVPALDAPAIFWLDAHWSGGETYGSRDECPVLAEIGIINASAHPHCILIDDARLFTAPPPPPHDSESWPDISGLLAAINAIAGRYTVIFDDVVISVPEAAKEIVREYCIKSGNSGAPSETIKDGIRAIMDGLRAYFNRK